MRVGVLGGGLQGCCVALSLAQHGIDVTLFDRNDKLLSRAAVANEGKIHLGYMYANDPSHSTARMMMRGALAFAPFFARHLGLPYESLTVSRPAAYVVHRDSQRTPDEVSHYIAAVHALIRDASAGREDAYFGRDLSDQPRMWTAAQREAEFDPEVALATFATPEVAIDPVALAQSLRDRISADRRIDVRLSHEVLSVSGPFGEVVSYDDGLTYLTWYPVCLQGISKDVTPPEWATYPAEPLRSHLVEGTLEAMAQFVPSLRALDPRELKDVTVKGGVIVAWGQTDIYDPASELHRRFEIGVTSTGRFHSIDPGKLTMAPYFADICAGRILEGNRH